jgi:hypothetical protein
MDTEKSHEGIHTADHTANWKLAPQFAAKLCRWIAKPRLQGVDSVIDCPKTLMLLWKRRYHMHVRQRGNKVLEKL